jgi:ring-1,2-phenylacetyl-CoA epoxidase subunit PaaB
MSYDVPRMAGDAAWTEHDADDHARRPGDEGSGPMWEVFVRQRRGMSHVHAGSLHAPDAETALLNARDVYTRRSEGVSVWVVPSSAVTASDPDNAASMFEPFAEQPYRHATYYDIPDEVGHM